MTVTANIAVTSGSNTETNASANDITALGVIQTGLYGVPASSPGTLISTITASNSATVQFTTGINSLYSSYEIRMSGIVSATSGTSLLMNVSTNGGSTWVSSASSYQWGFNGSGSGASSMSVSGSTSATSYSVTGTNGGYAIGNVAGHSFCGIMHFTQPGSALYKLFRTEGTFVSSTSGITIAFKSHCLTEATTAINGIQFTLSSGNISSGTFELWGIT